MTITLIHPSGAPRFTGATVEDAVKAAGLRVMGGTAYLPSEAVLSMNDHYCLVGAGITLISIAAPPAEPAPEVDHAT